MKQYSKYILVLALVLSFTIVMIACGDDSVPENPTGEESTEAGDVTSDVTPDVTPDEEDGGENEGDGTLGDTLPFDGLVGTDSTTDTGTDTGTEKPQDSITVVDGVMPDGGVQWGGIMTGRPVS